MDSKKEIRSNISTVDYGTWGLNEPKKSTKQTGRQGKQKKIVFDFFIKLAEVTEDPFWCEKFENAVHGKLPSTKFKFIDGTLIFKKGKKGDEEIYLSKDNPVEAAEQCIHFFKEYGKIFSPLDEETMAKLYNESEITNRIITWANASKKTRDCILIRFANSNIYPGLSKNEREQLYQILRTGTANKSFNKNNIIMEEKRIIRIEGLCWNENQRYFYIDPRIKPVVSRVYTRNKEIINPEDKDAIPSYTDNWIKYIECNKQKEIRRQKRTNQGKNNGQDTETERDTETEIDMDEEFEDFN